MKTIKNFLIYWSYFLYYYFNILINIFTFKVLVVDEFLVSVHKARLFALLEHHKVNQRYDKKYPYYYHLNMVTDFVIKFKDKCNVNTSIVILAALLHDTIEDLHQFTFNDIKSKFSEDVADAVFACTELRGKNRAERHGPDYFKLLQENDDAAFVKICDVCANMTMGKRTKSGMLSKYRKEYPKFKQLLYKDKFKPLFDYIEANLLTD